MRSQMVEDHEGIPNKEGYSELKVMRSAAGWYVGTTYHHKEGWDEPGSRDSDYFATHEEAEQELQVFEATRSTVRSHP